MISLLKFPHTLLAWTIFRWSALAILISMWSESAIAFVPIAKISNPPATINIVVNNLANYIETGGVRPKLIDGWDGKAEILTRMEHLLSIEQFSNSIFVPGIMNIKTAFAVNRHSMSWGVPIVFDCNFQLISELRNSARPTNLSQERSGALITNKENIIRGNVGAQFFPRSFFGTFYQSSSSHPQTGIKNDDESGKYCQRYRCPSKPPVILRFFLAPILIFGGIGFGIWAGEYLYRNRIVICAALFGIGGVLSILGVLIFIFA